MPSMRAFIWYTQVHIKYHILNIIMNNSCKTPFDILLVLQNLRRFAFIFFQFCWTEHEMLHCFMLAKYCINNKSKADNRPSIFKQFLDSIVVSIPACHAGDRGSIPRRGGVILLLMYLFVCVFYSFNYINSFIFILLYMYYHSNIVIDKLMLFFNLFTQRNGYVKIAPHNFYVKITWILCKLYTNCVKFTQILCKKIFAKYYELFLHTLCIIYVLFQLNVFLCVVQIYNYYRLITDHANLSKSYVMQKFYIKIMGCYFYINQYGTVNK